MTGFLVQDRYQEIEQFLGEFDNTYSTGQYAQYVQSKFGPEYIANITTLFGQLGVKRPGSVEQTYYTATPGSRALVAEVYNLAQLVSTGEVSPLEAQTYLNQKYPSQVWTSSAWQSFVGSIAAGAVIDQQSAAPSGDPDTQTPAQQAEEVQAAVDSVNQGTNAQALPITVPSYDDLPEEYDADALAQIIDDVTTQAMLNDRALNAGAVRFPYGSLDGGSIAPGTLPPTAMAPAAWSEVLSQAPDASSSLLLRTKLAPNLDRPYSSAGVTGPGRVRSISSVEFPPDYLPYRGIQRYRIAQAGTRFGVMGLLLDTVTPLKQIRPIWGFVLHRIPHYLGRPPVGITTLSYTGEAPVPFGYAHEDGGNPGAWPGTVRLFHDKAKAEYQDVSKTWATALGSDAVLDPTAADLASMSGIVASLITGRNAREVYQQLNTRVPIVGAGIRSSGHGPSASLPEGLPIQAPTTSSAVRFNGTNYTHLTESSTIATEAALCQGIPFSYEDCAKMVPTNTTFSLVVQAVGDVVHDASSVGGWPSPAAWYDHGFQLTQDTDRVVQVDTLIY